MSSNNFWECFNFLVFHEFDSFGVDEDFPSLNFMFKFFNLAVIVVFKSEFLFFEFVFDPFR